MVNWHHPVRPGATRVEASVSAVAKRTSRMSDKHPIIVVTGSSGSGRSVVIDAFENILRREQAAWAMVDGAGFHRYDRAAFSDALARAHANGEVLSHFAPTANLFGELEGLFRNFAAHGGGLHRRYIHDVEEAAEMGVAPGAFTEWRPIPENTDVLFYRGLHGCFKSETIDLAQYADLKLGIVPVVNLEWIQKIQRDTSVRGYSTEAVTDTILRRMHDYVHYIVPQFTDTDINFQRIATVDTSNPFAGEEAPSLEESMFVVRFRRPAKYQVDFQYLLKSIHRSFMSRRNAIVIPGSELQYALELIIGPIMHEVLSTKKQAA